MKKLRTNLIALTTLLTFSLLPFNSNAQLHVVKTNSANTNGSVGIGTTDVPKAKLEVNGSIHLGRPDFGFIKMWSSQNANEVKETQIDLYPLPDSQKPQARFLTNGNGATTFAHNGTASFILQTFKPGSDILFKTVGQDGERRARLVIKGDNVGIGLGNPTFKLHVGGTAAKTGTDGWLVLSDKRTKKNINSYNLGLKEVLKLNPVTFIIMVKQV